MKLIVSVLGGKDSTAMLLWAIEQGWDFDRGGKQLMLDHDDERRGCMRWGLCDA